MDAEGHTQFGIAKAAGCNRGRVRSWVTGRWGERNRRRGAPVGGRDHICAESRSIVRSKHPGSRKAPREPICASRMHENDSRRLLSLTSIRERGSRYCRASRRRVAFSNPQGETMIITSNPVLLALVMLAPFSSSVLAQVPDPGEAQTLTLITTFEGESPPLRELALHPAEVAPGNGQMFEFELDELFEVPSYAPPRRISRRWCRPSRRSHWRPWPGSASRDRESACPASA